LAGANGNGSRFPLPLRLLLRFPPHPH
jgi:hypothetical protein